MLFKTFLAMGFLSLGFFTAMAIAGAKAPSFDFLNSATTGGRGSGYHSIWHGGK